MSLVLKKSMLRVPRPSPAFVPEADLYTLLTAQKKHIASMHVTVAEDTSMKDFITMAHQIREVRLYIGKGRHKARVSSWDAPVADQTLPSARPPDELSTSACMHGAFTAV